MGRRARPWASDSGRRRDPGPDELRLFIAQPLPEDAASRLKDALRPMRDRFPGPRWLTEDSLHVTLLFLGPTPESDLPRLRGAIDAAALAVAPHQASTDSGGGRVGHPRQGGLGVAWLNLDQGADEAAQLAVELGSRLGTGDSWPAKGHAAHITVARRATTELVRALGERGAVEPVTWPVDRIVLFSSHLDAAGARYEALHVASLRR
jgi:2'-5' RNA ligase